MARSVLIIRDGAQTSNHHAYLSRAVPACADACQLAGWDACGTDRLSQAPIHTNPRLPTPLFRHPLRPLTHLDVDTVRH